MFENITSLTTATATIKIKENEFTVRKLKINEINKYKQMLSKSIGTVNTNLDRTNSNVKMNMEQIEKAEFEANKYLIIQTFTTETEKITEEQVNELYDLFNPLVEEIKRINGIVDVPNSEIEKTLKN